MVEFSQPDAVNFLQGKYGNDLFTQETVYSPGMILKKTDKGEGTSWSLFKFPQKGQKMIILSYDGQTSPTFQNSWLPLHPEWKDRITIVDMYQKPLERVTSMGDQRFLDVGYETMKMTLDILERLRGHYIAVDAFYMLNERVKAGMRKQAGLGLNSSLTGGNLKVWEFRNQFYSRMAQLMYQNSFICPIITNQTTSLDLDQIFDGKVEPTKVEMWLSSTFRHVISIKKVFKAGKGNSRFYAVYESLKDINLGTEGEIVDITGDRPIFDPAKMALYDRSQESLIPVKTPLIEQVPQESEPEKVKPRTEELTNNNEGGFFL